MSSPGNIANGENATWSIPHVTSPLEASGTHFADPSPSFPRRRESSERHSANGAVRTRLWIPAFAGLTSTKQPHNRKNHQNHYINYNSHIAYNHHTHYNPQISHLNYSSLRLKESHNMLT